MLHYQLEGADQAPTVVLIHGLFGDLDNLGQLGRHLAVDWRVLRIDLRNHGRSPHAEHMDWPALSADLAALLHHLQIDSCHLVGHSLGGKLAMYHTLQHPLQVKGLVVVDIAPVRYTTPRHTAVFAALQAVAAAGLTRRSEADQLMQQWLPEAGVRQFLLKSLDSHGWRFNLDALHAAYPQLMDWPTGPLSPWPGPVLFIKGGKSDYLLPEHQTAISHLFPAARAHILPDAGHWLHAEKPQRFQQLVVDFLSTCG